MNSRDIIKKKFSTPKEIIKYRLHASAFLFVVSFGFFILSFYFLGVKFYEDIFQNIFPYAYISTVFSLFTYIYYSLRFHLLGKIPGVFLGIYIVLALALGILFISPIVIQGGYEKLFGIV